jgi:hypothetical protein
MPDDANRNQDFDHLLNAALSSYAEPEAGLEDRVLSRLEETHTPQAAHKTPRWLPWAIALPLAACLILAATLTLRSAHHPTDQQAQHAPQPPTQTTQQSAPPHPPATAHPPTLHTVAAHTTRPTASKPAPLPKLDVFPTPRPLSPEEQALIHFVATAPESERNAMLAAQRQNNEPLHIAEIVIQPIASPDKPETEPNR